MLALTLALAGLSGQASACSFDLLHPDRYATCIYNDTYNKIVNGAKDSAAQIVNTADASASTIRNTATSTASATLKAAYAAASKVKAGEPQLCD